MFCIKKEQVRAFEIARFPLFEEMMLTHISSNFNGHALVLGKKNISRLIRHGYNCAREYGFETRYEVCLYIDLMIMLGHGFDTDPQLAWSQEFLRHENKKDTPERIDQLYQRAVGFMEILMGPEQFFPVQQFQQLITFSWEEMERDFSGSKDINAILKNFWPAKFDSISPQAIRELIRTGILKAREYGFFTETHITFYVVLMFLLGHRFDNDLQYPWIINILTGPEYKEEFYKAASLHFTVQHLLQNLLEAGIKIN